MALGSNPRQKNIHALIQHGYSYILGGRLKNEPDQPLLLSGRVKQATLPFFH